MVNASSSGSSRKRRRILVEEQREAQQAEGDGESVKMSSHLSLSPAGHHHHHQQQQQQLIQSPSVGASSCTSAGNGGCGGGAVAAGTPLTECGAGGGSGEFQDEGLHRLASDLESLLCAPSTASASSSYADAHIVISKGVSVPVHRCILSARSPYFARVLAQASQKQQQQQQQQRQQSELKRSSSSSNKEENWNPKRVEVDLAELVGSSGKIGKQVMMIVLSYLYGGKLRKVEEECGSVACMDCRCPHTACWPVIEFFLELLFAGCAFQLPELKTLAQERLMKMIPKAQAENVVQMAGLAGGQTGCEALVDKCVGVVARSSVPAIAVEKSVEARVAGEIAEVRRRLGLHQLEASEEKLCRRVYKALDSDDIELMQLLLTEAGVGADGVFALHYAASYCDVKTFGELLELGAGDINLRDRYGYTVLHAATLRRVPEIVGLVLDKGASPLDTTPDGLTALQLSRRIARNTDSLHGDEAREDWLNDRICVEILEQAENVNPCPVFPVVGDKELFMRLLYLENRVAFARLLWPREVKVVLGLSQLDTTKEFTADDSNLMDLNKEPSRSSDSVVPCMNDTLVQRVNALQKAIEVGHRFFPRCTAILNSYMDDGSFEHACIQNRRIPEHHYQFLAKRRRVSEDKELKNKFAEAFQRDVEEHQNLPRGASL